MQRSLSIAQLYIQRIDAREMIVNYPLSWRLYIQSLKYSIILFNILILLFNILKIFKVAEDLDLGCGVGGGKDSKDIFKVGIVTGSLSTRLRRGF